MSDPYDPNRPPPPPPYGTPPPPYGTPPPFGGAPDYAGYPPAYAGYQNPYAHWGIRLGGYLLDYLLLMPGYLLGAVGEAMSSDATATSSTQDVGILLTVVGYGAALAVFVWNQILRQGRTGQSLGKKWVGIRLVSESTGRPLGGGLTLGRYLLHILDALPCYLGFLWPLWDAKRQTFADKIVKSVVVRQG